MTNLQLIVLISAYVGHAYDTYDQTDTYRRQVQILLDQGMIKPNHEKGEYHLKVTDKGKAWLDHVLATPFPVEKKVWEIPNVKSS